jgi:phage gpG-like protein
MVEGFIASEFKIPQTLRNRLETIVDMNKMGQALDQGALLVENDAKRLVRVDTGVLRASINTVSRPMVRYIGSSKVYAAAQEFGRSDLVRYGYTPYLRPALEKNTVNIVNLIKKTLEEK